MRKYLSILAGLLFAGVVLAQKGERNMNNQASKFSVDKRWDGSSKSFRKWIFRYSPNSIIRKTQKK